MKKIILFLLLIATSVYAAQIRDGDHKSFYRVVIEANSSKNIKKLDFFDKNYVVVKLNEKKLNKINLNKKYVKDFQIINLKNYKKIVFEKTDSIEEYKVKKLGKKLIIDFIKTKQKIKEKNKFYDPIAKIILSEEKEENNETPENKVKVVELQKDPLYSLINEELNKEESIKIIKSVVVVIDPGHGGKDPGAIANGLREKDITLKLAKILKKKLEEAKIFKVYLTRNGDYYVDLYDRTVSAIKKKADIFISIHCNADESGLGHGTYIYTLNLRGAKSKLARLVERRENSAVLNVIKVSKNIYVNRVVAELAMNTTMTEGRNFAYILRNKLKGISPVEGIDSANFAVLKTPGIPSVLIETAYLTNKHDAQLLRNDKFLDEFATGIYKAIESYFFNYRNVVFGK